MTAMNFEKAQDQRDFSELVPAGTLCVGILHIKPYNATGGVLLTPTKARTGKYLKGDITIVGGKHDKRHVFTNLNVENPNPIATDIAHGAVKAMLECARHTTDADGKPVMAAGAYDLASYADLDGIQIAFKVKIEQSPGYADKNEIAVFLSPFQTEKDWARLCAGDLDPDPNAIIATKKTTEPTAAGATMGGGQNRWGGAPPAEQTMPDTQGQPGPANVPPQTTSAPPPATTQPAWLQQANGENTPK